MSAGTTPALEASPAPQRKVPRYKLTVPLDLTVLRSGIPDRILGRTLEIGEGGIAVAPASRLLLGESVRVEFLLPHMTTPVRATAIVRYQHERGFGLQFLRLPVDQQSIIRYWTLTEGELVLPAHQRHTTLDGPLAAPTIVEPALFRSLEGLPSSKREFGIRRIGVRLVPIIVVVAALGWWQWQQGWAALEAPVLANRPAAAKPQLQVPAEVMEQRVRHKVLPEYPEAARRAGVQGRAVLDIIVNAEGAVTQVKAVSGPEALSHAAMDAVRWWRYEPYSVNGDPVTVETTVPVDFQLEK